MTRWDFAAERWRVPKEKALKGRRREISRCFRDWRKVVSEVGGLAKFEGSKLQSDAPGDLRVAKGISFYRKHKRGLWSLEILSFYTR